MTPSMDWTVQQAHNQVHCLFQKQRERRNDSLWDIGWEALLFGRVVVRGEKGECLPLDSWRVHIWMDGG